ncbi:uncharacterized protein N7506_005020 [Penicillium brevicompactum]|uniref:uncharacterized protein n=1 Tax=Penicillium brevicompactum TaxID=5074 RepID=UPI002540B3A6|nr:uncharacterized protein N7506_005020 [Penicillium brevicompactum]KAJ5336998.1 hypothetical protein N7506_005020 [Penicillium brevicompactum]
MPRQRRGAAPTPARSAPTPPYGRSCSARGSHPAAVAASLDCRPPSSAPAGSSHAAAERRPCGVAVGSSIGHAIGGFFGGGSSAPAEAQQAPAPAQAMDNGLYQSNASQTSYENPACEVDVRNFRNCMDENQGNLGICGWYLDQLKACQAAAKPY